MPTTLPRSRRLRPAELSIHCWATELRSGEGGRAQAVTAGTRRGVGSRARRGEPDPVSRSAPAALSILNFLAGCSRVASEAGVGVLPGTKSTIFPDYRAYKSSSRSWKGSLPFCFRFLHFSLR